MNKILRFTAPAMAAGALAAASLAPGLAQAQTYSLKTLATPSGLDCNVMTGQLSSTGDVIAQCSAHSQTLGSLASVFTSILTGDFSSGDPGQDRDRIVQWRASGTTLKITGGTEATLDIGFLPDGSVQGFSMPWGNSVWKNGTRSKWTLPAGLPSGDWLYFQRSPSGKVLVFDDFNVKGRYAVVANGQFTLLPPLPSDCGGQSVLAHEVAGVGENGQVSIIAPTASSTYPGDSSSHTQANVCFWNGSAWIGPQLVVDQGSVPVVVYSYNAAFGVKGVTPAGKVLISPNLMWTPGGAFEALPANVRSVGVNGEWLGGGDVNGYPAGSRATIWRNGVAVDLNTVTTVPSGQVLTTALGTNAKGQILAYAAYYVSNVRKQSLVLLTPK